MSYIGKIKQYNWRTLVMLTMKLKNTTVSIKTECTINSLSHIGLPQQHDSFLQPKYKIYNSKHNK